MAVSTGRLLVIVLFLLWLITFQDPAGDRAASQINFGTSEMAENEMSVSGGVCDYTGSLEFGDRSS